MPALFCGAANKRADDNARTISAGVLRQKKGKSGRVCTVGETQQNIGGREMKKLRERLNKKGFTLVELIVVIVIILILAAVLVPNVMRYIDQANRAEAKSNAATALTELQGYEAEFYAAEDADMKAVPPTCVHNGTPHTYTDFVLTKASATLMDTAAKSIFDNSTNKPTGATKTSSLVRYHVENGVVDAFAYATTAYYINWSQSDGWQEVTPY